MDIERGTPECCSLLERVAELKKSLILFLSLTKLGWRDESTE